MGKDQAKKPGTTATPHTTAAAAPQKQAPTHKQAPASNVATLPTGCAAQGCKGKEKRFSFCDEHYDQFKFGLIKKDGKPVSDFDKKFDHYQAYKQKQAASVRKVA